MIKGSSDKRIVAFIDIFGFKGHISDATSRYEDGDTGGLSNLKALKATLLRQADDVSEQAPHEDWKISMFSDCVVISVKFDQASAVFFILLRLTWLLGDVLDNGFLVRGGVSLGRLHHDGEIIFGDGLIKAYEVESQTAFFPRVIVDIEVIKLCIDFPATHHSPKDELDYVAGLLKEDSVDGKAYLDILAGIESEIADFDIYHRMLKNVRDAIISMQKAAKKTEEKIKVAWLVDYFNNNLSRFDRRRKHIRSLLIK